MGTHVGSHVGTHIAREHVMPDYHKGVKFSVRTTPETIKDFAYLPGDTQRERFERAVALGLAADDPLACLDTADKAMLRAAVKRALKRAAVLRIPQAELLT